MCDGLWLHSGKVRIFVLDLNFVLISFTPNLEIKLISFRFLFTRVCASASAVYDYNSPYGESCYRLMTRTGDFIYLRTRGYLDIDRDTNQVRSFVCVNALVEEEEGKKLVREMKKKFTIMIQETEISSNEPDVPTVENPVQLERAIISLITNLHHGPGSSSSSVGKMIESPDAQGSSDGHESDTSRSVKSPPLEIIPPKPSSIKTSILNSMDVVNATLRHIQNSGKGIGSDNNSSDTEDDKSTVKKLTKVIRTSVVQRNANAKLNDHETLSNRPRSSASSSSPSKSPTTSTRTSICSSTTVVASTSSGSDNNRRTSYQFDETVTVKQEQPETIEDSRVPPLPTNAGYFEMSPYNTQQYIEDISSPLECKPFDFLGFDPMQAQQADQSRYLTPETAAQYQNPEQYNTSSDTNHRSNAHSTNQTPPSPPQVSGIKRSCSSEDLHSSNSKRRYYDGSSQCNTSNGNNDGRERNEKISLSIHQTCIDHLTDPELGIIFLFEHEMHVKLPQNQMNFN